VALAARNIIVPTTSNQEENKQFRVVFYHSRERTAHRSIIRRLARSWVNQQGWLVGDAGIASGFISINGQ
jgi:hypothetical protein